MERRRFQIRQTHRTGNSIYVTIPRDLCTLVGLGSSDQVYVYSVGGVICIKKFDEGGFTPEVIAVRGGEAHGEHL